MSASLPDAYDFDHEFFGFSRREAELLDPQQRLVLETAWELLETTGYAGGSGDEAVGVFAGATMNTYLTNVVARSCDLLSYDGTEIMLTNDKDYLPTRVSYKLGLRGPSVNVQTACSTSLVAVHLAVQSLLTGESDIALVGGVCVVATRISGYLYQDGLMMSPDGRCRPFDAAASGTTFGDGVGMVALKRLGEALDDGDRVLAVVRGRPSTTTAPTRSVTPRRASRASGPSSPRRTRSREWTAPASVTWRPTAPPPRSAIRSSSRRCARRSRWAVSAQRRASSAR